MAKRRLLDFFFIFLPFFAVGQQHDLDGIWVGKLKTNVEATIIFHFHKDSLEGYKGTMDSPDQGASGIPCSKIRINQDSVEVEVYSVDGIYTATIQNDTIL